MCNTKEEYTFDTTQEMSFDSGHVERRYASLMRFLICPDNFKGTLSSRQAADAIREGVMMALPRAQTITVPMADGGWGTLDVLRPFATKVLRKATRDPLGRRITSRFLLFSDTVFIEMAQTSGLVLLKKKERNPLLSTSFGVGELMKEADKLGVKKIILGLGGSATNDCGMGMLQALGVRFLDRNGNDVSFRRREGYSGGSLQSVHTLDLSQFHKSKARIVIASDVINPLIGRRGATAVYGPQKGATSAIVKKLERDIVSYAKIMERVSRRDVKRIPGAGAAGGLGACLLAFFDARMRSGAEFVMEMVDFERKLRSVDVVITGEGRIDAQSGMGKTLHAIARQAREQRKPLIAIGGSLGRGYKRVSGLGVNTIVDASRGKKYSEAFLVKNAYCLLRDAARDAVTPSL